jgi:hypothetical protein
MINDSFAPQSHFFIDPSAFTQAQGEAFGPVSASEFRLTSQFTVSAATRAYAVCKGVVLLQPQANAPGKVNLILRPFSQPLQKVNIKYFIYRGLNAADFISGTSVAPASAGSSAFLTKINADFASFYTSRNETVPPFLATYIGYEPGAPGTKYIDDYFFSLSTAEEVNGEVVEDEEEAFELPLADGGTWLGNFAAGSCGMDVVLSYGDYRLPEPNDEFRFDLAYARAMQASITLPAGTDYQKKVLKEQIFQFLDIAAYYGFHTTSDAGRVILPQPTGEPVKKTGIAIYNDLLQHFHTKNRLYLYIQSDRGRSYNFYGNYFIGENSPNSLKIGATEATMAEAEYGTNGWPLMIIDSAQAHNEAVNTVYLQLVTDGNVNTALYGQLATLTSGTNNFMNAEQLILPPDEEGELGPLTAFITLSNGNAGPSGAKVNTAGISLLIYQGVTSQFKAGVTVDDLGNPVDVMAVPNFFDDVFGEIDAQPLLVSSGSTSYCMTVSQKLGIVNQYYNRAQQGLSAVQTSRVHDTIETGETPPTLARVTYITEAVDVLTNAVSVTGSTTNATTSSPSVTGSVSGSKTYQLPQPYYCELTLFTDSTKTITGLTLQTTDGSVPDKIILGITKTEHDRLKALVTANTLRNARLFLQDLFEDGNELVSAENMSYQKYKAGIVGETGEGGLELLLPEEEVMVYSVDRLVHFSEGYSKYIVGKPATDLVLDLNVKLDFTE